MVRLDVFEAKMVAGPHRPSSSFQRAFLSSRSSVTASTTMSHVFRSAVVVVKRRRLRSEEHTSELQSRLHLVCRLLLEKKKNKMAVSWFLPMPIVDHRRTSGP